MQNKTTRSVNLDTQAPKEYIGPRSEYGDVSLRMVIGSQDLDLSDVS